MLDRRHGYHQIEYAGTSNAEPSPELGAPLHDVRKLTELGYEVDVKERAA